MTFTEDTLEAPAECRPLPPPSWAGKAHLTVGEACAYLSVSRTTFREWARMYRVKRVGRGRVVRYAVSEIRRLEARLTKPEK